MKTKRTLIVLLGPPAVGKMTVGQALMKRTGIPLFHNHLSIEPILPFFPWGTKPHQRLSEGFRTRMFREVAAHGSKGMIFTLVMDFDRDDPYLGRICRIFKRRGARICVVELQAPLAVRLRRNRTPNRLAHKPSKRNVGWSARNVRQLDRLRLVSPPGWNPPGEFLKLDTAHLSATATASRIVRHFRIS